LAAVGDAIIQTRLVGLDDAGDTGFRAVADVIRSADIASVNLETNVFDLAGFAGCPSAERGGSYLLGSPFVVDDLHRMGFHLFARGNNHAGDWGIEGLRATSRVLDARGLSHSGCGETMGLATKAAYLDTRHGRVASISLTTTYPASSRAGTQRGDLPGRPGCNAVKVRRRLDCDPPTYASLTRAQAELGNPMAFERLGLTLAEAAETRIVESLDARDVERNLREIRNAATMADIVLVNGHTHEPGNFVTATPDWLAAFARACIDAGATAYLGHGPHQLRGIEVYKGRPILYSLGNFVFHRETLDPVPADQFELMDLPPDAPAGDYYAARAAKVSSLNFADPVFYESVVPVMRFSGGALTAMTLHPIDLAQDATPGRRGTPSATDRATARRVVDRLASLSAALGTRIRWRDGVGVWRPDGRPGKQA